MVTENVPAVITEETAQMIFSIGKTIYFLRNHCRYNYILDVPFINTKQILETKTYDSKSILSAEFKTWLNTVYELTNKELVMVLFN